MYIDKSIIASAADSAMRHFNSEYRYKRITDYQFAAEEIRSMMTVKAWEKAINACGGYNFQQPAQNAEAAVAACIRAGLDKQTQLHYHNDWYRLQLNNQKYHVFREISGYTALPAPTRFTYYCHRSSIAFSGEEFADFLYSFDALVPDIRKATDEVLYNIRETLLEREKEHKIQRILAVAKRASQENMS